MPLPSPVVGPQAQAIEQNNDVTDTPNTTISPKDAGKISKLMDLACGQAGCPQYEDRNGARWCHCYAMSVRDFD